MAQKVRIRSFILLEGEMIKLKYRFISCFATFSIILLCGKNINVQEIETHLFHAGAAAVDITPTTFPVLVNGYMNERTAEHVNDHLMSRALVLDDGKMRLAIVVVDSLMIKRDLLDKAKQTASKATGIPIEHILISSTHTHTAASAMGCLGCRADPIYTSFLPREISKSIIQATKNLVPARIGWTSIQDRQHNHSRRWIYRSDYIATDPFGQRNVRANLNPGYQSTKHIGPSGPIDPDLSLLAVQKIDGKPLAVLGNYAMHYFDASTPISADFCGRFGYKFAELLNIKSSKFVGIMSQGSSGDSSWIDYSQPKIKTDLNTYTEEVAKIALAGYKNIKFHDWVPLTMTETTLKLSRRAPDAKQLIWAKEELSRISFRSNLRSILAKLGFNKSYTISEIYARELIYLHEEPEVKLKLQAIRIGNLGITAIPNEVYGITGLKLKRQSPFQTTINIALANGAQGYIPPPEQHVLGGYTTWPARTAGLETHAEPKIVETVLTLLEKISGKPRRKITNSPSQYAKGILSSDPILYWRFEEMSGPYAIDAISKKKGIYEPGVVFYLPGPRGKGLSTNLSSNRAAHFAGGRMEANIKDLGEVYSVEMWFWNGLPSHARDTTGYIFSYGSDGDKSAAGDHLGIGGKHRKSETGKLIFYNGNQSNNLLIGKTDIKLKTWNHVVLVRNKKRVTIYLNGQEKPEIIGEADVSLTAKLNQIFIGGRNDNFALFEGKLDEVSLYNRALTPKEVAMHYQLAGFDTINE